MTNTTRNTGALGAIFGGNKSLNSNRKWALIASYACLIVFVIFFLCPPFYMLITSLKTNAEIADLSTNPWLIEQGFTIEHYVNLLTETAFLTYFKNTVIVAFFVVLITMIISVLAG